MNKNTNANGKSPAILMGYAQDIGYAQQRTRLEDRLFAENLQTKGGLDLYMGVIADGVGGSNAGERAAEIVIETAKVEFLNARETDINKILNQALLNAQKTVREESKTDPRVRAMSTTATVTAIYDRKLYVGHVGDSRVYLVRDNKIKQLTMDHSWGNEKVREGAFSLEEVSRNPRKDELARYIGQPIPLVVDLGVHLSADLHPKTSQLNKEGLPLQEGDVVVMCSDGLIKERRDGLGHYVEPEEIVNTVIRKRGAAQDAANTLVSLALGRKTDDNVSVIVMEVPGGKAGSILTPVLAPNMGKIALGVIGLFAFLALAVFILTSMNSQAAPPLPSPTAVPATAVLENPPTDTPTLLPVSAAIVQEVNGNVQIEGMQALVDQEIFAGQKLELGPGQANFLRLTLPNGNLLALGENTSLILNSATPLDLTILQGTLLVHGQNVTIQNETKSFTARLTEGLLGLQYTVAEGNFHVDCLAGACQVGDTYLTGGQRGGYTKGLPAEFDEAEYTSWFDLGQELVPTPTLTPSPTSTPTETPTLTPTPAPTKQFVTPTPRPTKEDKEENPPPAATEEQPPNPPPQPTDSSI